MNPGQRRSVPGGASLLAAAALLLAACVNAPDVDGADDPLVVTEGGSQERVGVGAGSPERQAAVAQMRRNASLGDALPYPDAFGGGQMARLAARAEPIPVADVAAIEAELEAISRRQQSAVSPQEIAALKARAEVLRRLAAQNRAAGAKARRNPAADVRGR